MTKMRAKLRVSFVLPYQDDGKVTGERVGFAAVYKSGGYPADGSDEDNTFAKFTPSASLDMQIANPDLFGKFKPGDTFYVDFTPAS